VQAGIQRGLKLLLHLWVGVVVRDEVEGILVIHAPEAMASGSMRPPGYGPRDRLQAGRDVAAACVSGVSK
jgi:hypothetical protein